MARTDTLINFLTDIANAIRTKKGTTDVINASDFDTEIETIPSGSEVNKNEEFIYLADTDRDLSSLCSAASHRNKNVTIKQDSTGVVVNMAQCFRYHDNAKTIDLQIDTSKVTNFSSLFDMSGLSSKRGDINIIGNPIDFTSATNVSYMFRGWLNTSDGYSHMIFKENTLKLSMDLSGVLLDGDSLVSVINSLKVVVTKQTLTLHPTNKHIVENDETFMSIIGERNWEVA